MRLIQEVSMGVNGVLPIMSSTGNVPRKRECTLLLLLI